VGSPNKTPSGKLIDLLSELADGELDDGSREELSTILRADDRALAFYYEWISLHALLHLDLTQGGADVVALRNATDPRTTQPPVWRLVLLSSLPGVLAACLLLAIIGRGHFSAPDVESIARFEREQALKRFRTPTEKTVAVLSEASEPVWIGDDGPQVGAGLPARHLSLEAGVVQLEFVSGSIVVLEGPAEIDLVSPMQIDCQKGRLRVCVPSQAHGFTIDTPTQRTIDLGTEFAVNVTDQNLTEIHVIDGEVEVHPLERKPTNNASPPATPRGFNAAARTRLTVGMGMRAEGDSEPTAMPAQAQSFVGTQELQELLRRGLSSRQSEWLDASRALKTDDRVLLYYSFEGHEAWDRALHNDGPIRKKTLDGAIVGGKWTEGRWPWKHAIEFKRTSDRVRTEVLDECKSITLACWVRIDGFDRRLSALFMTDGHEHGEVHWQFTETGQLLLCVKTETELASEYLSDSALRLTDVGRWVNLACVYDGQAGKVTHYLDGQPVGSLPIAKQVPLRFGRTELGNWQSAKWSMTDRVRGLNGRMDEFVLFNRPLTSEEIAEFYRTGRP
jgi:hypothetical protein